MTTVSVQYEFTDMCTFLTIDRDVLTYILICNCSSISSFNAEDLLKSAEQLQGDDAVEFLTDVLQRYHKLQEDARIITHMTSSGPSAASTAPDAGKTALFHSRQGVIVFRGNSFSLYDCVCGRCDVSKSSS